MTLEEMAYRITRIEWALLKIQEHGLAGKSGLWLGINVNASMEPYPPGWTEDEPIQWETASFSLLPERIAKLAIEHGIQS
jgi:hypothetical protein